MCHETIEDDIHAVLKCNFDDDLMEEFFDLEVYHPSCDLTNKDKFVSVVSNVDVVKHTTKPCQLNVF